MTARFSVFDCSVKELSDPLLGLSASVANLQQWSEEFCENFNACQDRVTSLEQWGEELAASLCWVLRRPRAGKILGTLAEPYHRFEIAGVVRRGTVWTVYEKPCFLRSASTVYEVACFLRLLLCGWCGFQE